MPTAEEILECLNHLLVRTDKDSRQIVVMTCGIAGSGKSTLSKAIVKAHPSFERISIDRTIYVRHGIYGIDYPIELYQGYQDEAHMERDARLLDLLVDKKFDIMLDQSFWSKRDRDETKQLIENHGARWVLVSFSATKEPLWKRIQQRSKGIRDADSAFEVTEEVLDSYIQGFETPHGEGEIKIEVV